MLRVPSPLALVLILLTGATPAAANNFACSNPYGGAGNYQCWNNAGYCQCLWNGR
jgi:hypothetical protein